MNSISLARNAYAGARVVAQTGRDIEYQAFVRATRKLTDLDLDDPDIFPMLAEALHENLTLWTVIAQDVAHEGNTLPKQLRAQLFYLYEFTRAHTRQVLKGSASIAALVDINRSVMRGLKADSTQE